MIQGGDFVNVSTLPFLSKTYGILLLLFLLLVLLLFLLQGPSLKD